jgi:hypothetical protein
MSTDLDLALELEAIELMRQYGDAFESNLAEAWRIASPGHAQRLRAAFPEILAEFTRMAHIERQNEAESARRALA